LVSEPSQLLGYRPDYIAPEVLAEAVKPLFPDVRFSVVRGAGQRAGLFASGPVEAVERFEKMAQYLDRPPEAVEVQAIIVEVSSGTRSGFGVSMVLDALRSTVGFTIAGPQLENQLSFRSGSFDAVLSAVASTSSARVLSSPRLRGRSGEKLRLQVGNDVPTLAAVIDRPSGSTQQSILYRSSGTIFEVVPDVLGKRIGVALHQELSAFAATETGVQGSPTLTTRQLDTTLDLESGEWAVIGGLTAGNTDTTRQSLFGLVPIGKTKTERRSELVLLLNVRTVGSQSRSAASGPAGGKDAAARN
jgi:type II secretory pathway component GspD/PulD (secretin)